MKNHKRILTGFLALPTLIVLATLVALTSEVSLSKQQPKKPDLNWCTSYPVADYASSELTNEGVQLKRSAKNIRYNDRKTVISPELPHGVEPLPLIDHTIISLPALPITKSYMIVLGNVVDAGAYMSGDRTGVYSEFSIRVDEVLKSEERSATEATKLVIATREGGAVRYPSGRVSCIAVQYQGMPRLNSRYILFLKRTGEDQEFSIITGYELKEGRVFPLDGADANEKNELRFAAFTGTDENAFMAILRGAVAEQKVTDEKSLKQ